MGQKVQSYKIPNTHTHTHTLSFNVRTQTSIRVLPNLMEDRKYTVIVIVSRQGRNKD